MLTGLVLFWVGAVLILNGLWMQGRIGDREIVPINVFVGSVSLAVAIKLAFGDGADLDSVRAAAFSLLFAFTYLWAAYNRMTGADGRGLGWYSGFVALTAVPVAVDTLRAARGTADLWLGVSWAAWAVLWALFFLLLALGKPLERLTAKVAIAQGVLTGWVPGYLLLTGALR